MANETLKNLARNLLAAKNLKEVKENAEYQAKDEANQARRDYTDAHARLAEALKAAGLIDTNAGWLNRAAQITHLLLDVELKPTGEKE